VGLTLGWDGSIAGAVGDGAGARVSGVGRVLVVEEWGRVEASGREWPVSSGVGAESEDAALAAGCLAGDLGAFERLYELHGGKMRNLARHLLRTQSDAEDAVQDTFLKVQRKIATFRGQSSFVTWTFRILVNTCHDVRRGRMRRKEYSGDEPVEEGKPRAAARAQVAHPTLRMALDRAIAELTQHQRDVFLLYEVEGFRHVEIAGILDITETASKNTLFQAKKSLRTMLEPPRSAEAGAGR
jgi:RNA polymerase sigma-70 factor (ECF subfamily)